MLPRTIATARTAPTRARVAVQSILQLRPEQDVNPRDEGGNTPLHTAARNGHAEVIELLLTGGADARRRNAAGESAADRARQQGHTKLAERLS